MVKLTQLIMHIGDEMNVEQKRYGYGQSNIDNSSSTDSGFNKSDLEYVFLWFVCLAIVSISFLNAWFWSSNLYWVFFDDDTLCEDF